MNNILTQNKLVKNLRAYPVLRKRWRGYIRGVRALPEGFTEDKLFHDYLRVRRSNPEKRVSMSEYMIFGFYGLTTAQQKQYLTDVEATLLMRPYNSIAEPYLKSKVTFLKNFTQSAAAGCICRSPTPRHLMPSYTAITSSRSSRSIRAGASASAS